MAIKAYEYIAIGEQLYKDGVARPVGDSWQVKAQQKGFDEADARQDVKDMAYGGAHDKPYSLGDLVREKIRKNSGVFHHIELLREMALNERGDMKRTNRLLDKASKLAEKHSLRNARF